MTPPGSLSRFEASSTGQMVIGVACEAMFGVVLDWAPEHPEVQAAPVLETFFDEFGAGPVADLS